MMTKTKRRPGAGTPTRQSNQSIAKRSAYIVSLFRAAVKLAITADLVLLLAFIGSLNVPGIIGTTLTLNALCGLILKQEENNYEKV